MIGTIYADGSEKAFLKEVEKRSSEINNDVEKIVKEIIADVKENGDKAVKAYTAKFDCADVEYYRVPDDVIMTHLQKLIPNLSMLCSTVWRILQNSTRDRSRMVI